MDDDMDGAVKAEHVMKVLKLLSQEYEGLPTKLFEEVVEMMVKEEQLEAQVLAKKALELPFIVTQKEKEGRGRNAPADAEGHSASSPDSREANDSASSSTVASSSSLSEMEQKVMDLNSEKASGKPHEERR